MENFNLFDFLVNAAPIVFGLLLAGIKIAQKIVDRVKELDKDVDESQEDRKKNLPVSVTPLVSNGNVSTALTLVKEAGDNLAAATKALAECEERNRILQKESAIQMVFNAQFVEQISNLEAKLKTEGK